MQKQFGRSMIEMLGVLAVIAVLSIGGLLGYRRAVNNHHANQILDDANRLAFVMIESNQSFTNNEYITNSLEFTQTSIYNTEAFLGAAAGQFGIVVEDVPRGVCESLLPKAATEYKIRVMPPSETFYQIQQMSDIGIVYDSFHEAICNDMNDIALYFGDTSAQCNKPEEGEDYIPCLSNAECCGTHFCVYVNATDGNKLANGSGQCQSLSEFNPERFTASGKQWAHARRGMNTYSAYTFCAALGMSVASRADIGCTGVQPGELCSSSILDRILETIGAWGWAALELTENPTEEKYISVRISHGGDDDGGNFKIGSGYFVGNPAGPLCH